MRLTPQKLANIIATAIGRTPDSIGNSGNKIFIFEFNDTDISASQRTAALNAMPDLIKLLYSFDREVVTET